ncbi:MAG: GNAT family N-acetyltransferase [Sulfitobacter sp.]
MPIHIRLADPQSAPIRQLIQTHIAYGEAAYPSESNHHLTPEDIAQSDVMLFAAWEDETCLGMLGLSRFGGSDGEVKSMHVIEAARGRGVAAELLDFVVENAQREGLDQLFLETGSREASAAARRLYERFGFEYCAPFGNYKVDPESVFMKLTVPQT